MSELDVAPPEAPQPPRARDAARPIWTERLARFAAAGLPTMPFCAAEGVSVASFSLGKRRLAPADPAPAPQNPSPQPAPRCLPVCLPQRTAPLELLLPSGAVLRLDPGADEATLRGLLRLRRVPPC
jgi:hypothetical protein